jgi:hypothetical protein
MLRGRPDDPRTPPPAAAGRSPLGESTDFPGIEQSYSLGERPPGVLFYRAKGSFWLPYHLLQAMEFTSEAITLAFADEDIVIEGRGLHPLYVELAWQRVARVVEQGERYATLAGTSLLITRIERRPRERDNPQQPEIV